MTSCASNPFFLKVSAPGKLILFGEYSVVFNKPAVAATLGLRTRLTLRESEDNHVHLILKPLNIDVRFSLSDVNQYCIVDIHEDWDSYIETLKTSFETLYKNNYGKLDFNDPQCLSAIAFFHCFQSCFQSSKGFQIVVDTDLSTGSGVGSSASFSVVLAASAYLYQHYLEEKNSITTVIHRQVNGNLEVTEKLVNLVSDLSYSCEKIFHGSPSGVDNNTILRGHIMEFIKSNGGKNKMTPISSCSLNILLVNTNVKRTTKKYVENVKQLHKSYPEVIDCVLTAMENVAKNATNILKALNGSDQTEKLEARLGELISLNHNLLRVLGVSHPSLENIVSIANKYNLKAKLTGGGGGGFAYIYLPSHLDESVWRNVEKELTGSGYTVLDASLGVPGLMVEELTY